MKERIPDFINDLIHMDGQVSVPGLGRFEIQKTKARIENGKVFPPVSGVVFFQDKTAADTSLIEYISQAENLSIQQAEQLVSDFCDELYLGLESGEYKVAGLGSFKCRNGILGFEQSQVFNADAETFKLRSVALKMKDFGEKLTIKDYLSALLLFLVILVAGLITVGIVRGWGALGVFRILLD